ncbi:MAG: ATP-binding protein [Halocynthiibacter sp.]
MRKPALFFAGLIHFFLILIVLQFKQDPKITAVLVFGLSFLAIQLMAPSVALNLSGEDGHGLRIGKSTRRMLKKIVEEDASPAVLCDAYGLAVFSNGSARDRFGIENNVTKVPFHLSRIFEGSATEAALTLARLTNAAKSEGHAVEQFQVNGTMVVINALYITDDYYLIRLFDKEIMTSILGAPPQAATPVLRFSADGQITFTNAAMKGLICKTCTQIGDLILDSDFISGREYAVRLREGDFQKLILLSPQKNGETELFFLPQEALPASIGVQRDVFEDIPIATLSITSDGRMEFANRQAQKLLGQNWKEGGFVSDVFGDLGRPVNDWLADAFSGKHMRSSEIVRILNPDHKSYVQVNLYRSHRSDQPRLFAFMIDATEMKSLELQFAQSQKMQAIGQLAGGIAHDFNNLLTAISGHCDLLLLRHEAGDFDYSDLVQINQNANRAAALVGQLLAFSRKQTLRPEVLNMRDVLSDLTHLLNRLVGETVSLCLRHDVELDPVRVDKRQFEQVIMNLVVNARDAMPDGGCINVHTSNLTLNTPLRRDRATVPPGNYVVIKIEDEGTGITDDVLEQVFEPFFSTKPTGEGTGLGLSTVYGIVKQTGGYVFVDTELGKGSAFQIYLPTCLDADDVLIENKTDDPVSTPLPAESVVLLVEDEESVRAFAARVLQLKGIKVVEADCGEMALSLLEDPSLEPNLIISDVVMPGLDGPSWVAKAFETRAPIDVIFTSGYAEEAITEHKHRIPNAAFLNKPFSLGELTNMVSEHLHDSTPL